MSRGPHLTGLVLAALVFVPREAMAQADAAAQIGCEVAGYDLVIRNQGAAPIASGTVVAWSVPFARKQGEHALAAALEPGGALVLSAALGSTYLDARRTCSASIG